jgi:energy-coupling factor transport system ATP-binding protein
MEEAERTILAALEGKYVPVKQGDAHPGSADKGSRTGEQTEVEK